MTRVAMNFVVHISKEAAAQKKIAAAQNKKATNRKRGQPRTKPNIESELG